MRKCPSVTGSRSGTANTRSPSSTARRAEVFRAELAAGIPLRCRNPKVSVVSVPLCTVTPAAQNLKVCLLAGSPSGPRKDVIDVEWPLILGRPAEGASPVRLGQNPISDVIRNRALVDQSVVPDRQATTLKVFAETPLAERTDLGFLLEGQTRGVERDQTQSWDRDSTTPRFRRTRSGICRIRFSASRRIASSLVTRFVAN